MEVSVGTQIEDKTRIDGGSGPIRRLLAQQALVEITAMLFGRYAEIEIAAVGKFGGDEMMKQRREQIKFATARSRGDILCMCHNAGVVNADSGVR